VTLQKLTAKLKSSDSVQYINKYITIVAYFGQLTYIVVLCISCQYCTLIYWAYASTVRL